MKKKFFLLPGVLCMAASLCLNTGRIPVMAAAPDSNGAGNTAGPRPRLVPTNNTKQEEKKEIRKAITGRSVQQNSGVAGKGQGCC